MTTISQGFALEVFAEWIENDVFGNGWKEAIVP